MNITYLLGNGFDLNLGMKTKYEDFYRFYLEQENNDEFIKKAKNEIKEYMKDRKSANWMDLELALGEYTEKVDVVDDFLRLIEDICENLGEYLEEESKKYNYEIGGVRKIKSDLCNPENHLGENDKLQFSVWKEKYKHENICIDIITFNYTKTIENILSFSPPQMPMGKWVNNYTYYLRDVQHVHGFTDERMVLGVNDTSQIKNEQFKNEENIKLFENFVKPISNEATKELHISVCERKIQYSHLICLFGLSIGDTDKIWWQKIGSWLESNTNGLLIIFARGKDFSKRRPQLKREPEREIKEDFLSKTSIADNAKANIRERILVVINTEIFKIELPLKEDSNINKMETN